MNIKATETNGKFQAKVSNGDQVLFVTPEYLTEAMALADAKCWMAFHGEKETKMDPMLEEARRAGLEARKKIEAENTVTVSSGTHLVPFKMAFELRKPSPSPKNGFDLGKRMRARQQLFKDAAALLGISYAEAQTLPRMLRENERRHASY